MKKNTITSLLGEIGIFTWCLTIFLRTTPLNDIKFVNFILGIMPNISATWFFIWMGETLITRANKVFDFKTSILTSLTVGCLALISEIIHHYFLNSPFDIYDIFATLCSILLYILIFYMKQVKVNT